MSSVESTSPVSGTLSSTNTETLISVLTSELSEPGLLLSPGLLSLSPGCVFSSLGITVMSALSPHTVQWCDLLPSSVVVASLSIVHSVL